MFGVGTTQLLIGSLGLIAVGLRVFVVAFLVSRGHVLARKRFYPSVKPNLHMGILLIVAGLLSLGRLAVPPRFADVYAAFFFTCVVVLIVGVIATALYDRRAQ